MGSASSSLVFLSNTLLAAGQIRPLDPPPSDGESSRSLEEASPAAGEQMQQEMHTQPSATTTPTSSPHPQTSPPEPSAASAPLSSADPSADERRFHNVTSVYHYITTLTLRSPEPLARWLAEQFERDQTAFRKYLKLLEQAPGIARDPHVRQRRFSAQWSGCVWW
jgi:hypothetical protein